MAGAAPWLSVVIAARNERRRLPALLAQLAHRPALVQEVLVARGFDIKVDGKYVANPLV